MPSSEQDLLFASCAALDSGDTACAPLFSELNSSTKHVPILTLYLKSGV